MEVYIGKESNKLEDAEAGLVHDPSLVLEVYADTRRGPWERLVRPVLPDIPARWLEQRTGLSRRTIQRLRNGHSSPRKMHERELKASAAAFARATLIASGMQPPLEEAAALSVYLKAKDEGAVAVRPLPSQ